MKNKMLISVCMAFAFAIVSQDIHSINSTALSMFLPSFGIEYKNGHENNEKLFILDGDSTKVVYSFKLEEIFRKLFD